MDKYLVLNSEEKYNYLNNKQMNIFPTWVLEVFSDVQTSIILDKNFALQMY